MTIEEEYTIGKAIKEIRVERGIKQKHIAEKAEISNIYLSEIERGLKTPTLATLEKICNAMKISLPLLILEYYKKSRENEPNKNKKERDFEELLEALKPLLKQL